MRYPPPIFAQSRFCEELGIHLPLKTPSPHYFSARDPRALVTPAERWKLTEDGSRATIHNRESQLRQKTTFQHPHLPYPAATSNSTSFITPHPLLDTINSLTITDSTEAKVMGQDRPNDFSTKPKTPAEEKILHRPHDIIPALSNTQLQPPKKPKIRKPKKSRTSCPATTTADTKPMGNMIPLSTHESSSAVIPASGTSKKRPNEEPTDDLSAWKRAKTLSNCVRVPQPLNTLEDCGLCGQTIACTSPSDLQRHQRICIAGRSTLLQGQQPVLPTVNHYAPATMIGTGGNQMNNMWTTQSTAGTSYNIVDPRRGHSMSYIPGSTIQSSTITQHGNSQPVRPAAWSHVTAGQSSPTMTFNQNISPILSSVPRQAATPFNGPQSWSSLTNGYSSGKILEAYSASVNWVESTIRNQGNTAPNRSGLNGQT